MPVTNDILLRLGSFHEAFAVAVYSINFIILTCFHCCALLRAG